MIKRKLRQCCGWVGLFLLLATGGYAQSTSEPQEITVYLKDGKIIKGMTTLSMFEGYLTIEEDAFNQTHIPYSDIRQILFGTVSELEQEAVKIKKVKKVTPYTLKESGYYSMIDFGNLIQSGGIYETGVSLTMVNGYAFNPYLRAGIGLGVESYGYNEVNIIPVYLNLSGLLNKKRWSPYYFLNVGNGFAWLDNNSFSDMPLETRGGLMVHPGLGYIYHLDRIGISFGLGYKIQKAQVSYGWDDWNTGNRVEIEERRTLRRLNMSMGIHF